MQAVIVSIANFGLHLNMPVIIIQKITLNTSKNKEKASYVD
jgi:hypothetical protein